MGELLRRLRKQRKMTLENLSERTGISVSSLSRIENTQLSLSIEKLKVLASALDVSPHAFLSLAASSKRTTTSTPIDYRHSVDRAYSRTLHEEGEARLHYMFPELKNKALDCIYFEIAPIPIWDSEFISHPGEKIIHVLSGDILVYVQYKDPVMLEAGDSMFIDSAPWHSLVAANNAPATALAVYYHATNLGPGSLEQRQFTPEEWAELRRQAI